MSSPIPPKEELSKALRLAATTLSDDAQNAALRKCKELGFDTNKGVISLEETLINLSSARDTILDAVDKRKLGQLPLKLQYSLYSQTTDTANTLTSLVNGTDAVVNLVTQVDDLTASIWQYNLTNLSGEVLGFQTKMNQLKTEETRLRQVARQAEDFVVLEENAKKILSQIEDAANSASATRATLQASSDEVNSVLSRITEQGQKISSAAAQIEQHETTAAQQLANSKQSAADTDAIASKCKDLQSEIFATRSSFQDLATKTVDLLASTQAAAMAQSSDFQRKYEEHSTEVASQLATLTTKLDSAIVTQTSDLSAKAEAASTALLQSGTEMKGAVERFLAENTTHLTQSETNRETRLVTQLNDFTKKTEHQLLSQAEAFNTQTTSLAGEAKSGIAEGEGELKRLVSELETLEGRIRESIERATGYGLFHSFQKRQLDLAKSKDFWGYALGALVMTSLIASGVFIYSLHYIQVYNAAVELHPVI